MAMGQHKLLKIRSKLHCVQPFTDGPTSLALASSGKVDLFWQARSILAIAPLSGSIQLSGKHWVVGWLSSFSPPAVAAALPAAVAAGAAEVVPEDDIARTKR